jgi:hypothetical protein
MDKSWKPGELPMPLQDFRVQPTDDGDKVTILADEGDVRVITTIPRGVIDDISPSTFATAKEREAFIVRNLGRVSGVIETKFRLGQFESDGRDGHERFIRLDTVFLRGLDLK